MFIVVISYWLFMFDQVILQAYISFGILIAFYLFLYVPFVLLVVKF